MGGFEPKLGAAAPSQSTAYNESEVATPGKRTLVEVEGLNGQSRASSGPGKQTLTERLSFEPQQCVMRPQAAPRPGINETGFIDHSDGANIRDAPLELGGQQLSLLPPATRVFVSGTYAQAPEWWYVTALLDSVVLCGYVQGFRVNTKLPEPLAELHQVVGGDTVEQLAKKKFSSYVKDGHDLRFYENVLLKVNKGRGGIHGTYQDPGILGGGSNNIQLSAGHRIWLVSGEYALSQASDVPSGSFTGGAVAKLGHVKDILAAVKESYTHFEEIGGEFAQSIRDHMPMIIGLTTGFLVAETGSMLLAATPTGAGQAAAVVIQLALSALGAAGMVEASWEALKHGKAWLEMAWQAYGKADVISEASREFCRMLVAIALAALAASGAKHNYQTGLKIAGQMPRGGMPALATAGVGPTGGADAAAGVATGGPGMGAIGAAGMMAERLGGKDDTPTAKGSERVEEPVPGLYDSVDENAKHPGWNIEDRWHVTENDGTKVIETIVTTVDGGSARMIRAYNPRTKKLELREAFLKKMPRWVNQGGPAIVKGKGIPTQAWLTIRQMKALGVSEGAVQRVKMSRIQNLRSILEFNLQLKAGVDPDVAVLNTFSIDYAETSIIQSGHQIKSGTVTLRKHSSLRWILEWYETKGDFSKPRDPVIVAEHDRVFAEYGKGQIDRDTPVQWDYDILLVVGPFEGKKAGVTP